MALLTHCDQYCGVTTAGGVSVKVYFMNRAMDSSTLTFFNYLQWMFWKMLKEYLFYSLSKHRHVKKKAYPLLILRFFVILHRASLDPIFLYILPPMSHTFLSWSYKSSPGFLKVFQRAAFSLIFSSVLVPDVFLFVKALSTDLWVILTLKKALNIRGELVLYSSLSQRHIICSHFFTFIYEKQQR